MEQVKVVIEKQKEGSVEFMSKEQLQNLINNMEITEIIIKN